MVVWKGASFLHFMSELSSPKRKVVRSNRIGNSPEPLYRGSFFVGWLTGHPSEMNVIGVMGAVLNHAGRQPPFGKMKIYSRHLLSDLGHFIQPVSLISRSSEHSPD
jgi:hypothetical protein